MTELFKKQVAILLGIFLVAGCTPGATVGALNNYYFVYECTSAGDAACSPSASEDTGYFFPRTSPESYSSLIAQGSEFAINVERTIGTGQISGVEVASPEFLEANESGKMKALREGFVGIRIRSLSGPIIEDFTHLHIRKVSSLKIARLGGKSYNSSMKGSEEQSLVVVPYDSDGNLLYGTVPVSWTVNDPSILELAGSSIASTDNAILGPVLRIKAIHGGNVQLTATSSGIETSVTIKVGN
jgi:hypothetical protein